MFILCLGNEEHQKVLFFIMNLISEEAYCGEQ